MKHKSGSFILFLSKATLIFVILALCFAGLRYFYEESIFYFWGNNILLALYAAILYLSNRVYNGFNFGNVSLQEIVLSWILSLIVTNAFQYFILSLFEEKMLSVVGVLIILGVQLLFVIPMVIVINIIYNLLNPAHDSVIIYGNKEKLNEFLRITAKHGERFKVNHVISQNESLNNILNLINASKSVFFLNVNENKQEGLLEYCYLNDKHVFVLPSFSRILINTASTIWVSHTPIFSLKTPIPDMSTLLVKRLIDIIVSLIVLILTGWLMIGIWFAVRLYDNHPAIYRQTRVTKDGKLFTLLKFRSMRPNAEDDGVPRLTAVDDDRVTPFGRFIRKSRLDELPQVFNVLSGAMSIVGPRPERPEIAAQYEKKYPNFAFRTKVKAGITGFAQIYGRYNTAPEEKLFLDIMYIETFSIIGDLKLMLQTINVLFLPTSTEGIENDSITALREKK
ncbi:MAG: exopolysaccharide biosynthesis polyprenyl glycosylphosphotransferase [Oscillospiraceae bacterium]|jgi:exopolysaccharide biosynthesis polyprenyl glycosylphosphotransferase|nr:exopolysaccharide biosynthesis polyprenyl glycosylphosphotransferase [Oscillospiraceae bacterium]